MAVNQLKSKMVTDLLASTLNPDTPVFRPDRPDCRDATASKTCFTKHNIRYVNTYKMKV